MSVSSATAKDDACKGSYPSSGQIAWSDLCAAAGGPSKRSTAREPRPWPSVCSGVSQLAPSEGQEDASPSAAGGRAPVPFAVAPCPGKGTPSAPQAALAPARIFRRAPSAATPIPMSEASSICASASTETPLPSRTATYFRRPSASSQAPRHSLLSWLGSGSNPRARRLPLACDALHFFMWFTRAMKCARERSFPQREHP
mmetsp:Transcript_25595/g.60884  ORF Transcript_25595/g.60884 Transcript_25595/m.60884 type:complete len:200 (+) Transcript_25595:518-1117(+)